MYEIINVIKKELADFVQKKKELVEQLRLEFPKMFSELLSQLDTVDEISWYQYTPYFNDGDICTFRCCVNDLYVDGEDSYTNGTFNEWDYETLNTEEDVVVNDMLAEKYNKLHMIGRKVGQSGLVLNPNYNKHDGDILFQIKSVLNSIPEEFYLELFGDHVEITLTKSGKIIVNEFEHD